MVKPSDMHEDGVVGSRPYVWLLGRFGGIRKERLSGATKAVNLEVTISSTSTPKKTPIESEG